MPTVCVHIKRCSAGTYTNKLMQQHNILLLLIFLLMTSAGRQLPAQDLVPDDDTPGVLVPAGYDLRLVVTGLNFPSNIAAGNGRYWVCESGYLPTIPPTVKEITLPAAGTGTATAILTPAMLPMGTLLPPFTDVVYHDSLLYLGHRQVGVNAWMVGAYSRFDPDNPVETFETILTNLPSVGDHSNNTLVFGPDGRAYFGQGSATNTGVVGPDNGWVTDAPMFHEKAPVDIVLNGSDFTARVPSPADPDSNAVTAAYRPFDSGAIDSGLVIRAAIPARPDMGIIAGSGTVYSFDPSPANDDVASTLRLEAWGLRNPFGLAFDATDSTRLFISNNGSDIRGQAGDPNDPLNPATFVIQGSRPIAQDYDDMFEITTGGKAEFFGWPDYFHDPETKAVLEVTDSLFCESPALTQEDCPGYLFAASFRDSLKVSEAFTEVGLYVSVTGFTASTSDTFGYQGNLFVTESGSFSPQTGAFTFTGYKVSRIDHETGDIFDFVVNVGSTPEELFVPTKMNKPVADLFVGDQLAIVDLGVVEPGIDIFQSGTGKVWLLSKTTTTASGDLFRNFGAELSSVVPNPTADDATIKLSLHKALEGTITLHDMNGHLVGTAFTGLLQPGIQRIELSVGNLPPGTYLVQLASADGVLTRRFIVAR